MPPLLCGVGKNNPQNDESFPAILPIRTAGMISLRKHIDGYRDPIGMPALNAFRSSLTAMAQCGLRAIPPLGTDLSRKLIEIDGGLDYPTTPDALSSASRRMAEELSLWADLALHQHDENTREMQEIVGTLERAADSVTQRDEKYSHQIGELTGRLKSIAGMNDLPVIRRSIMESATALRACVEQMARDSTTSVEQLSKEVEEYRVRLRESERLSAIDPLTGLGNRRAFEVQLQARIESRSTFSLLMLDLNGFKAINDEHGHLAGDDLLKQFAVELSAQFTAADLVGRWGGDEFVVLVSGDLKE